MLIMSHIIQLLLIVLSFLTIPYEVQGYVLTTPNNQRFKVQHRTFPSSTNLFLANNNENPAVPPPAEISENEEQPRIYFPLITFLPQAIFPIKKRDSTVLCSRTTILLNPFGSSIDLPSLGSILTGHAILLGVVLVNQLISGFTFMPPGSYFQLFDFITIQVALTSTIILLTGTWLFEKIPWEFSKRLIRSNKIFSYKLLGRSTKPIIAGFIAALLAINAGISEEIFFRGFVYTFFDKVSNPIIAIFLSSLIYGLAHFPFALGATAAYEVLLGLYFSTIYYLSGYNIAIPIVTHAIYDFCTIYGTWLFSEDSIMRAQKEDFVTFQQTCRSIFDMIDIDQNGRIDKTELALARRLLFVGPILFGVAVNKEEFDRFDKNKDGYIDFNEFELMMEEEMKAYPEQPVY